MTTHHPPPVSRVLLPPDTADHTTEHHNNPPPRGRRDGGVAGTVCKIDVDHNQKDGERERDNKRPVILMVTVGALQRVGSL